MSAARGVTARVARLVAGVRADLESIRVLVPRIDDPHRDLFASGVAVQLQNLLPEGGLPRRGGQLRVAM